MKLTPEQTAIKRAFRDGILLFWEQDSSLKKVLDYTSIAIGRPVLFHELTEIPSLGNIFFKSHVRQWLANKYPKTSLAMWNKKPHDQVLAIWKTEKPVKQSSGIASKKDKADLARAKRINSAIQTFNKTSGDRYEATNWKLCK